MRLNKRQIAVITVLNVVIAALVAAIFLLPAVASANGGGGGNGGNTDVITPPTDEHEKLREPTAGRVPQIQRETRLMGTGDETVEAVHFVDGIAFIFGNATVSGLDFDSYGGFLCMVGSKGNILGFTYFDGRLTAVGVAEGGFAAATIVRGGTDEAVARLYSVDYDGKAEEVATLDGAASDIIAIGGTRVAVADERGELAALRDGTPQFDLGGPADVLELCPKKDAVMHLIKTMAPKAVALDEITSPQDAEAVCYAANCGTAIFATAHAYSLEDFAKRGIYQPLLKIFDYAVELSLDGGKRSCKLQPMKKERKALK